MAKRKADSPLNALSPNKPLAGTRRVVRTTPVSDWPLGKENEDSRRSVTPFVASTLKKSGLRAGEGSSRKRSRLGIEAGTNSVARKAVKGIGTPSEEHSLTGSRTSSRLRKDNVSAECPVGEQLTEILWEVDGHRDGPFENQQDFTGDDAVHSGAPGKLNQSLTYTRRGKSTRSQRASPSGPVSVEKEISSRERNIAHSEFEDLGEHHEVTLEGNDSNEDQTVLLRNGDIVELPSKEKEKEGAVLSVEQKSLPEGQGQIDNIGRSHSSSDGDCEKVPVTDYNTPLVEEPVGTKASVLVENGSQGNLGNPNASAKAENMASVKTKNSRGSHGRERTHRVPNGKSQGRGERCPTCKEVGHPHLETEAALFVLEEAYNKLYKKYQRSKTTRNLAEVEAIYDEQTSRFAAFSAAADNLVGKLRQENGFLRRQLEETCVQEIINRSRQLEDDLIECKNNCVMERSKVFGLEQQLSEAQQYISLLESRIRCSSMGSELNISPTVPAQQPAEANASQIAKPTIETPASAQCVHIEQQSSKSPSAPREEKDEHVYQASKCDVLGVESEPDEKEPAAERLLRSAEERETDGCARQPDSETCAAGLMGGRLLREVLQNLTQMSVDVDRDSCGVILTHKESGFSFKLEQNVFSREIGGDDALLYKVIAPGTLLHAGPGWMREDMIFDIVQVEVFFQRILAVARGYQSKWLQ